MMPNNPYQHIQTIVRFTVILIASVMLFGCDTYEGILDDLYKPNERSHPKKLLKISGELESSLKIKINAVYHTNRKSCRKTINWLKGAFAPREFQLSIPIKFSGTQYSATIPLDKLESGYCKWALFSTNYSVETNKVPKTTQIPSGIFFWLASNGAVQLPQHDIECAERTIYKDKPYKKQIILCRKPLGKYFISLKAKEIHANFRKHEWINTPNKKLTN